MQGNCQTKNAPFLLIGLVSYDIIKLSTGGCGSVGEKPIRAAVLRSGPSEFLDEKE